MIYRIVACWLVAATMTVGAQGVASAATTQPASEYMIVVTGAELLAGAYGDAHTSFLARMLRPLGLRCIGSMLVDDRPEDIRQAVQFARSRASLVIMTGGLGPTDNDITRQTLTQVTGVPLQEHPAVLADMERRFKTPREQLRPNLRRQTQVPVRGTYLKNNGGTAVGLVFEMDGGLLVALPGPPRELQPMVREELVPLLIQRLGARRPGCSLMLRFVGVGQSQISQTIQEKVKLPEAVTMFSQFEGGRVDFTFDLPLDGAEEKARLEDLKRQMLEHLGPYIYATDETTLEQHVAGLLASKNASLALAEVGSGGALAASLSTSQSGPAVLAGAYVAGSEETLGRMLDVPAAQWAAASGEQRMTLLASALAKASASEWALVVGQAQRDGGGGHVVEVMLRLPGGKTEMRRVGLRGTGELARAGATTQILDWLRKSVR